MYINNQIGQITVNSFQPAVMPRTSAPTLLDNLPLVLIFLCLTLMFLTFLIHKRNKNVSMFIPVSTAIISAVLAFLFLVPLPFKRVCDFSPVDGPLTNCEKIYITSWSRFVEIINTKDTRSVIPRQYGIFPAGRVYY